MYMLVYLFIYYLYTINCIVFMYYLNYVLLYVYKHIYVSVPVL